MSKHRNLGLNLNVNVGHNLREASAAICEVGKSWLFYQIHKDRYKTCYDFKRVLKT